MRASDARRQNAGYREPVRYGATARDRLGGQGFAGRLGWHPRRASPGDCTVALSLAAPSTHSPHDLSSNGVQGGRAQALWQRCFADLFVCWRSCPPRVLQGTSACGMSNWAQTKWTTRCGVRTARASVETCRSVASLAASPSLGQGGVCVSTCAACRRAPNARSPPPPLTLPFGPQVTARGILCPVRETEDAPSVTSIAEASWAPGTAAGFEPHAHGAPPVRPSRGPHVWVPNLFATRAAGTLALQTFSATRRPPSSCQPRPMGTQSWLCSRESSAGDKGGSGSGMGGMCTRA